MDARRTVGPDLVRVGALFAAALALTAWAAGHAHNQAFTGYSVADAPTTGTVSFTLPALSCNGNNEGMVPTLQFSNSTTNVTTSAGVYTQCLNGAPNYAILVEINNHYSFLTQTLPVGDKIRLNIAVSSKSTTVAVSDLTNKSSVKQTVSGPGGGGSFDGVGVGEVKIGSPGEPIAPFRTLVFSAITVNGSPLGAGGTLKPADMYNVSALQIKTGAMTATATQFTTTFVAFL